jgi:hypothetical protein
VLLRSGTLAVDLPLMEKYSVENVYWCRAPYIGAEHEIDLASLRTSPGLQEGFTTGDASVFRGSALTTGSIARDPGRARRTGTCWAECANHSVSAWHSDGTLRYRIDSPAPEIWAQWLV